MNAVRKTRLKTVIKYTWPLYLVLGLIAVFSLCFIFSVAHRTPAYKTLTLFIAGEYTDTNKLTNDMLEKYQEKELKNFSCVSANPNEGSFYTKLTTAGYNSADVLIINTSKLENLKVSSFALELPNELISTSYQGYTLYQQDDVNYGIKINKEKVKEYMSLPEEDCYMLFNYKSENLGQYSKSKVVEHDNALNLVKEWGM